MRSKVNIAVLTVLSLMFLGQGGSAEAADLRKSALVVAEWAVEANEPQALASSLAVLLEEGGTLDQDDPFSVLPLADALRDMPGGADLLGTVLETGSRGQLGGAARLDLLLAPGETHETDVFLVGSEVTWIEARLWRGSGGADIDVELVGSDGTSIAADISPQTGIEGIAALVDVWIDSCVNATLRITNAGGSQGRVALFVPQSPHQDCEAPG